MLGFQGSQASCELQVNAHDIIMQLIKVFIYLRKNEQEGKRKGKGTKLYPRINLKLKTYGGELML